MPGCDCQTCPHYRPGHLMHVIHASRLARTPWGWRDALVSGVTRTGVTVRYLEADHELTLWHHRDLRDDVPVGSPVRVHEGYYALGWPGGWANVRIEGRGLGAVPEPADPIAWAAGQGSGGPAVAAVDLATGLAVAVDHHDPGR
jgi:hypothetical protein